MVNHVSNYCIPQSIPARNACTVSLVTVVAAAAIGAMAISSLAILGNLGPMAGMSNGAMLGALAAGGGVVSTILLWEGIALIRLGKRVEVEKQRRPSSKPTHQPETQSDAGKGKAIARSESPVLETVSESKTGRDATIEEWQVQFPRNALRRLEEKTPIPPGTPPSLTPEEISILEEKAPPSDLLEKIRVKLKPGVHIHSCGDHIVFEIDEIDGVVFKAFKNPSKKAQPDLALKVKAQKNCTKNNLYLIQIPAANYVTLSDGREVIVERKIPNLRGTFFFQKELYQWGWNQPCLQKYFVELFSQLLIFIREMKFGDCKYNNIPISIDGNLGLIDIDEWGAPEGLIRSFMNGSKSKGYGNEGLLNSAPSIELLNELVGKKNEKLDTLLEEGWLKKFLNRTQEDFPDIEYWLAHLEWLDELAREAIGEKDLNDAEKIAAAIEHAESHPASFTVFVGNLPEDDPLFKCMAQVLGATAFIQEQVKAKVKEIKSDPARALPELVKDNDVFEMLGKQLLIAQKIVDFKEKPEQVLDLVRGRILEREKRYQEFASFQSKPLGEFSEVVPMIQEIIPSSSNVDPQYVYQAARLALIYIQKQKKETSPTNKQKVEIVLQDFWDEVKNEWVNNKRFSHHQREGVSLQTNLQPAFELLYQCGCIFRYEYEKPKAGPNASQFVTVELR